MTVTQPESPQSSAASLRTRSGLVLAVRRATPNDKASVEDFFRHVSADDLRFRFLGGVRAVDDQRIAAICGSDARDADTFLAFSGDDLVALATLAGEPAGHRVEAALLTRPEWKRQGISWTLLEYLLRLARTQGYEEIVSIEKAENSAALALEREMGFRLSLIDDDGGEVIASKSILSH